MSELDKPTGHLATVKWRFPSVHPEGRKFTLIAGSWRSPVQSRQPFSRLAADWPDDLGRGLLPRPDPHHARSIRS